MRQVSLVGGILGSNAIAQIANNFDLELSESNEPFKLTGSLNIPQSNAKWEVAHGNVNFLNRNFEILPQDKQEHYYINEKYKIHKNTISLQVGNYNKQVRAFPNVDISALSIIEKSKD